MSDTAIAEARPARARHRSVKDATIDQLKRRCQELEMALEYEIARRQRIEVIGNRRAMLPAAGFMRPVFVARAPAPERRSLFARIFRRG